MLHRGIVALFVLSGLLLFACNSDLTGKCLFNHMIGVFEIDEEVVPTDGNLTIGVRVSLIGEGCQEPLEGATIELFSSRNQRGELIDVIDQPDGPTDRDGLAEAHVHMTAPGTVDITAAADGALLCKNWEDDDCVPLVLIIFYEYCPVPLDNCNDECVDIATDPDHCGGCDHACKFDNAAAGCVNSTCIMGECNQGYDDCDNDDSNGCETDLLMDSDNCNECGNKCLANQTCREGECQLTIPCEDLGLTECDGECVDTDTDFFNCGACGVRCDVGGCCREGRCFTGCNCYPPNIFCSGMCVDPMTNNGHCGRCDNRCAVEAGYECQDGVCGCPPGVTDCGVKCTNLDIDPEHCGQCNHACAFNEYCYSGWYPGLCCPRGSCAPPNVVCDVPNVCPTCVDPQTNNYHCGASDPCLANPGTVCDTANGFFCRDWTCQCAESWTDCTGVCVDLDTDEENCGICGYHCDPGVPCIGGMCPEDGPDHVEAICPENALPSGGSMQCEATLIFIWGRTMDVTHLANWHQDQEINSGGNCTGGNTDATCGVVYSLDAGLVTMTDNPGLAGDRENIWAEYIGLTSNYWSIQQPP